MNSSLDDACNSIYFVILLIPHRFLTVYYKMYVYITFDFYLLYPIHLLINSIKDECITNQRWLHEQGMQHAWERLQMHTFTQRDWKEKATRVGIWEVPNLKGQYVFWGLHSMFPLGIRQDIYLYRFSKFLDFINKQWQTYFCANYFECYYAKLRMDIWY